MKYKSVRKKLIELDLRIVDLAKILDYTPQHTRGILCGSISSERGKKMISVALDLKPEDWDEPYSSTPEKI